ncbi:MULTISPECIES: putative T6SS immunity periplasmic lipoprotein [Citrobacter]|uniref:Lipoprotein n=2 Tax=Citrobacter freundii complex TaxID=1344959 RepID=A0ABS1A2Q8_9ENTR|nr:MULTISPECIES: putative T6SS immunity periplasmic lipoprotein [Citrobacter]AWS96021.1 hypothetical protein AN232_12800 [Citrobacter sp. CRE-46]KAA0552503.1 hypothetical protein F0329_17315 [Citrobacter werkmanii]MBD0820266.1 hypothetical protein [Citrobacter sp. C5_2]MBJ8387520.1 hypothetical protein [Citrobacter cronae]MBJ8390113.1 hypothetical protein [Citrobacter cronae]
MKRLIIMPLVLMLSGCPGGMPAPHPRVTFINGNYLCFSTDQKDVLNYYRIESSRSKGYHIEKSEYDLQLSYPSDCIDFKWSYGYSYTVSYGLNGKDYVHKFFIDNNGQLTNMVY